MQPIGSKHDQNKPQWDLVPYKALEKIVDVLTFGAKKYSPGNWKIVPDGRTRYFSAMMRHLSAWHGGETLDPESNLHHLGHAGCCLLFLIQMELEKK